MKRDDEARAVLPGVRRPLAFRVMEIEELEGLGITERFEQARLMGLSMPHLDRVRRAAREAPGRVSSAARDADRGRRRARRSRKTRRVQLGVRVPAVLLQRLRDHSKLTGWSVAVLSAVAIDDWLNRRGSAGPSGLDRKLVAAVNL